MSTIHLPILPTRERLDIPRFRAHLAKIGQLGLIRDEPAETVRILAQRFGLTYPNAERVVTILIAESA